MSDYIKREDAIAAIEEIDWYHVNDKGRLIPGSTSHMESYVPYDRVESAIQTVPAADVVERKRGKWIEDSGNIACSICHTIWLHRRTNYCPNCGAYMRGQDAE